jgi:hypothetical protein
MGVMREFSEHDLISISATDNATINPHIAQPKTEKPQLDYHDSWSFKKIIFFIIVETTK